MQLSYVWLCPFLRALFHCISFSLNRIDFLHIDSDVRLEVTPVQMQAEWSRLILKSKLLVLKNLFSFWDFS